MELLGRWNLYNQTILKEHYNNYTLLKDVLRHPRRKDVGHALKLRHGPFLNNTLGRIIHLQTYGKEGWNIFELMELQANGTTRGPNRGHPPFFLGGGGGGSKVQGPRSKVQGQPAQESTKTNHPPPPSKKKTRGKVSRVIPNTHTKKPTTKTWQGQPSDGGRSNKNPPTLGLHAHRLKVASLGL